MKKTKNIKIILIGIILFIVIATSSFYLYNLYEKSNPKLTPGVKELIDEKKKSNYSKKEEPIITNNYINQLPEFRSQYNNPYIMGKLEIPNLNINTLVTRYTDNNYYLDNNLYNQRDGIGAPFFDYRNTDLKNNKQINIYGHNTTNPNIMDQLPFINLAAYIDENIFRNYKDVYLSIDEEQMKYKVIATKIIDGSDNEHMKLLFYSSEDYLNHVSKLLQRTMYKDSMLEITVDDSLLVMQVCHYNPPNTYLLIICKKTS